MGRYKRHSKTKTLKKDKKHKALLPKMLARNLIYVLKKHNKFGSFINSYKPFGDAFDTNLTIPMRSRRYDRLPIGKYLTYEGPAELNYNTMFGRLCLVNNLLIPIESRFTQKHLLSKEDILAYYAEYEVEKNNIKVYPNNMIFSVIVGSIFALIGFFTILFILWIIFGFFGCLLYSAFVLFVTLKDPHDL